MGVGRGATTLPCKKKIVEKPPRNSAGFCGGGGQGLSWAVEPRKEEDAEEASSAACRTKKQKCSSKSYYIYLFIYVMIQI
jgi:hypothetical protein